MTYVCIKPECDAMNCVGCNCAVPEDRSVLVRLRRLQKLLAAGRDVDGLVGLHALDMAIAEIESQHSVLVAIERHADETIKSNSRDRYDWIDDVDHIRDLARTIVAR